MDLLKSALIGTSLCRPLLSSSVLVAQEEAENASNDLLTPDTKPERSWWGPQWEAVHQGDRPAARTIPDWIHRTGSHRAQGHAPRW